MVSLHWGASSQSPFDLGFSNMGEIPMYKEKSNKPKMVDCGRKIEFGRKISTEKLRKPLLIKIRIPDLGLKLLNGDCNLSPARQRENRL
ncbi:hypothetical protein SRHO_G00152540 [Serrasalmus rhombeus]